MKQGFIKVAAVTPKVKVADVTYNVKQICNEITTCANEGVKIMVFPELCLTGYTCGDLFLQDLLLEQALLGLKSIIDFSKTIDGIIFVGLPFSFRGKLYNTAAAVSAGRLLGLIPKKFLPNYNEFYEVRYFESGQGEAISLRLFEDTDTWFGTNLLFQESKIPELILAAEICEDLWTPEPPSISHALHGATVIVNLSASDETTGKNIYRRELVNGQSARLLCGYVYASAGDGESTQDVVYSGHNLICENGRILKESERFINQAIITELDIKKIAEERRRMSTFHIHSNSYRQIEFSLQCEETLLTRYIDPMPFVPGRKEDRDRRCDEILMIQSMGLKKRLLHTQLRCAVIGISGGLDSTLALLVTVRAFELAGLDKKGIYAVTMPGFGTTDRTYQNAVRLIDSLEASFFEIPIVESVTLHFRDIGHDASIQDVTYENGQARERTQILMDVANKAGGLVIGTGDMSELALGWATYNGDHMSMYGVNASVPKTLVRHLVRYYAETSNDAKLGAVLMDILDTPVSPELLPPQDGEIIQKTEDIVGPYELHDFFLYHMLREGCTPKKVFRLADIAFADRYDTETIVKWLENFYRRFFSQQFKRSCLPDGPKVGTIAVSPRGDLRMPSDASAAIWMKEIDNLKLQYDVQKQ
ncbi:MAG: NAD(+) synthase [Lachnospiraceae bacterium]